MSGTENKQKDFKSQNQDKQGHCKTSESVAWGHQRAGCISDFFVRYILYVNPSLLHMHCQSRTMKGPKENNKAMYGQSKKCFQDWQQHQNKCVHAEGPTMKVINLSKMQVQNLRFHILSSDIFNSTLVLAKAWMISISIPQARCGVFEHPYHSKLFTSTLPLSLLGKMIGNRTVYIYLTSFNMLHTSDISI